MPKRACIFFTFILLLTSFSFAAQHDFTPFLRWGAGARPMGMGKAFSFLADDPNAIYFNPAGLGFLSKVQIEGQLSQEFYRVTNNFFGITKDNWGIGYQTYGQYVIPYWKIDNTYDEFLTTNCSLLMLAYAHKFNSKLSVGGSLKSFLIDANKGYVGGKSLDLGLLYKPSPLWQFGLAAQDLFSLIDDFRAYKSNSDDGPLSKTDVLLYPNIKVGLANFNKYFNFTAELINIGYNEQLHWGFEKKLIPFVFDSQLALRLGAYGSLPTYINSFHKLNKSIGISSYKGWLELDYALEFYPDGGTSARSSGIIRGEGLAGIFPFLVPLITPTPPVPSPPSEAPTLIPRQASQPEQEESSPEATGGVQVNIEYFPQPHYNTHGAFTADVTLIKFPVTTPQPVMAPSSQSPAKEFPCTGKQPSFMQHPDYRIPTAECHPLLYQNIPIQRPDQPPSSKNGRNKLVFDAPLKLPFEERPKNIIRNLTAGKYLIKVDAAHSIPWYNEIDIYQDQVTIVTATLEPAYGGISGKVIDYGHLPVAPGTVEAYGPMNFSLRLDAYGNFSIGEIPSGSYRLRAVADYRPGHIPLIPKEVFVQVPSSYNTQAVGTITMEAYYGYGNISGEVQPAQALQGCTPGSFSNVALSIWASPESGGYPIQGNIDQNYRPGHFTFSDVPKGRYSLIINPVGGWYRPLPIPIDVPDMKATFEVGTIILQSDPAYLPDLQFAGPLELQQESQEGGWQNYPASDGGTNDYKVHFVLTNLGSAPSRSFMCRIFHRITPIGGGSAQEFLLGEERIGTDNVYSHLTYPYYFEFEDTHWQPNAINEIVVRLDPLNNIAEIDDSNNEAFIYLPPPNRDAKFVAVPQLHSVTPFYLNHAAPSHSYQSTGNIFMLSPGDRLHFRAVADGIRSGDELTAYLVNPAGATREVYSTTLSDQNVNVEFPVNQSGKWKVRFKLVADGDEDPANNQAEIGPLYVLMAPEDISCEASSFYTEQPVNLRLNFRNQGNVVSEGGFVNYKVEVQSADNLNILITTESFPRVLIGGNPYQKLISIPGGILAPGLNNLRITFTDPASPNMIVKYYSKDLQAEINPQYITDPTLEGKKVVFGIDSPFLYFNTWKRTQAQGEYYDWQYFDALGRPYGMGLGAKADAWLGERSQVNGYISKAFYVESGDGRLYDSRFQPTVDQRMKDRAILIFLVNYIGVIDSALFQPTFTLGMDYYLAKIDAGLASGNQTNSTAENHVLNSDCMQTLLLCERGIPVAEVVSSTVDIVTMGASGPVASLIFNKLIARGVKEATAKILSKILAEIICDTPGAINYAMSIIEGLDTKEKLVGSYLVFFENVPIQPGNTYTLFVKGEVQARCGGVAWAVTDFQGCYTKLSQLDLFKELERGIWVTGAAIHFEKSNP